MYRHDYILRMIEQLARTLIALRNRLLQRELSSQEVRAEIHQIARDAGHMHQRHAHPRKIRSHCGAVEHQPSLKRGARSKAEHQALLI